MSATLPNLLPMLRTLVETPSVSATDAQLDQSNRPVIDHLAGWLETLGFAVEILPLPDQPEKANLIATLGSGPGGLVLAGHTDTVPFDEHLWSSAPLGVAERDNRLYGLGTCDMKGFLALALEVAKELDPAQLREPLILLATADEESSMEGARALAELGRPQARAALVGEPTALAPARMHKGMNVNAIRLNGRSGHSSDPRLGANALDVMHPVLGEVMAFREALAREHRHPAFEVDYPTMNLGCLHAGDNPNRICGSAELQVDMRVLPGMDTDMVQRALEERLHGIERGTGVSLEIQPLHPPVPPYETPANSGLVRAVERLTGAEAGAVAFGTEAPFFHEIGMDAVVCGPGSIEQAHQPDEYLDMKTIEPTLDLIRGLVRELCM